MKCIFPGDLIYMPRGAIHEAMTTLTAVSMHITVGIDMQFSTWEAAFHFAIDNLFDNISDRPEGLDDGLLCKLS